MKCLTAVSWLAHRNSPVDPNLPICSFNRLRGPETSLNHAWEVFHQRLFLHQNLSGWWGWNNHSMLIVFAHLHHFFYATFCTKSQLEMRDVVAEADSGFSTSNIYFWKIHIFCWFFVILQKYMVLPYFRLYWDKLINFLMHAHNWSRIRKTRGKTRRKT